MSLKRSQGATPGFGSEISSPEVLATDYMYAIYDNPGTISSSAYAWKGNCVIPYKDITIKGLVFIGTVVSGATYSCAVATMSGTSIATWVETGSPVTADATEAETTDGTLLVEFDNPVILTAGTEYFLMMGRTDSTDTYALPVQYPTNRIHPPFGTLGTNASMRVAKAAPAVSDTGDLNTSSITYLGVIWGFTDTGLRGEGAYRGVVKGTDTQTTGTSHSLTLPTLAAGDLIAVFYVSRNSTTTGPSGYTERYAKDLGTDEWTYLWTKEAVGSETTVTLTGSGADTTTGVIVLSGDYVDSTFVQATQYNPQLEAESDQYMLACFMANYTSTAWTTMAGAFGTSWTTHFNVSGTSTDLMLVGRSTKWAGPTTPYNAGGGGGVGNQYQIALTVLVSSP